jgi:uncharacterized protein
MSKAAVGLLTMIYPHRWHCASVVVAAAIMISCFAHAGVCQLYVNGKPCWDSPCLVESTEGKSGETRLNKISNQARRLRSTANTEKERGRGAMVAAAENPAKPVASVDQKVALQVNQNDKAVMELALNNAHNIIEYYKGKGQTATIEIVAYGPGLHMLRADTSPVRDRIAVIALENPNLSLAACANTQINQSKSEGKPIALLSEAKVVPSGVVRLIELQEQGYAYIRP